MTDTTSESKTPPELVLLIDHLNDSPVSAEQIKKATRQDSTLATALQYIKQGWPHKDATDDPLKPYYDRREELSVFDGCILWGNRVVVPRPHQKDVLSQLHEGHPSAAKMKGLSRMNVWWPGITREIENAVKGCCECQQHQSRPPVAPLHPWAWPTRPWARLHIDYAGSIKGQMVLIIIDAHFKYIEAMPTSGSTSQVVIEKLRTLVLRFGLPKTIVSDNGTCFTSEEFRQFLKRNGVARILSAPYHPSSNGLAERAVQVVKRGLRKVTKGSLSNRLATVLFTYRLAPQSMTELSPSELLLGRPPRTRLDLLIKTKCS